MIGRAAETLRGLWSWARSDDGQGLTEYGLILVLISIVAIVVMDAIGEDAISLFTDAASSLADAVG